MTYKQPAECAGNNDSGEKQSDAIVLFVPLVPHAEIEHDSREEPTLRSAQEEARGEESAEALSETHEGADDTPHESDCRKPHPRGCKFEDEITRDIEQDVADKIDGQGGQVLVSGLIWIAMRRISVDSEGRAYSYACLQRGLRYGRFQLKGNKLKVRRGGRRVTIASVQEREKEKKGDSRKEVQIEFPQQFLLVDCTRGFFFRLNRVRLVDLQLFFLFGHGGEEGERQERGWGMDVGFDRGYLSWGRGTCCEYIVMPTECRGPGR